MDHTCSSGRHREQETNMGSGDSLSSTNLDDGSGLTSPKHSFVTWQGNSEDVHHLQTPLPVSHRLDINANAEDDHLSDKEDCSDKDERETGELLDDISRQSDDDKEFQGFRDDDLKQATLNKEKMEIFKAVSVSGDAKATKSKEAVSHPKKKKPRRGVQSTKEVFVSDFDLMMQKKKEERQRKKKRKLTDLINDTDNQVADFIQDMKYASDQDIELCNQEKTATMKFKFLPFALSQLKKWNLKEVFLNLDILSVIADWLSPLPDGNLPHFSIREGMIRTLAEFAVTDRSLLKSSGVGRAIMFLYNHPEETKANKERIRRIVAEWSRPAFNVTNSFHSFSEEEEREAADSNVNLKRTRLNDEEVESDAGKKSNVSKPLTGGKPSLTPGQKVCNARAQIPGPSTTHYAIRPKWNVGTRTANGSGDNRLNRFQQRMKTLQQRKRVSATQRAATVNLDGNKVLF